MQIKQHFKYEPAAKKCTANTFTHANTFIYEICLISESYLGPMCIQLISYSTQPSLTVI